MTGERRLDMAMSGNERFGFLGEWEEKLQKVAEEIGSWPNRVMPSPA